MKHITKSLSFFIRKQTISKMEDNDTDEFDPFDHDIKRSNSLNASDTNSTTSSSNNQKEKMSPMFPPILHDITRK